MRLFSADFRAGQGAEAVGDLVEATRSYAACGCSEGLARVVRRRAEAALDPRVGVDLARDAVRHAGDGAQGRDCERTLAEALLGLAAVTAPAEARALRREAAGRFAALDAWAKAAEAREGAGDWEAAADDWERLGEIERMRAALRRARDAALDGLDRDGLHDRVAGLLALGRADEAIEVAEAAGAPGMAAEILARAPPAGWLDLDGPGGSVRLFSPARAEVGRAPELPLSVAVGSISRRHVALERRGDGLWVEDLSSGSGVRLGGRVIRAEALTEAATLELGGGCRVELRPVPPGWSARAFVADVGGPRLMLTTRFALDEQIELRADGRWWRADGRVLLIGDELGRWRVG